MARSAAIGSGVVAAYPGIEEAREPPVNVGRLVRIAGRPTFTATCAVNVGQGAGKTGATDVHGDMRRQRRSRRRKPAATDVDRQFGPPLQCRS
jgi:hypothetical protein